MLLKQFIKQMYYCSLPLVLKIVVRAICLQRLRLLPRTCIFLAITGNRPDRPTMPIIDSVNLSTKEARCQRSYYNRRKTKKSQASKSSDVEDLEHSSREIKALGLEEY